MGPLVRFPPEPGGLRSSAGLHLHCRPSPPVKVKGPGISHSPWQGRHTLARHVADPVRGRRRAARDALRRRPVNWAMNAELGAEGRADPLDGHIGEPRAHLGRFVHAAAEV
ncbi:hypothetical protein [Streptomyces sp. NPDC008317]|uniref:hypothetical protein n=1 Tax=Streptomyces sp. NPDC008317 TaxID=3364827 RepID=UPI0036ECC8FF